MDVLQQLCRVIDAIVETVSFSLSNPILVVKNLGLDIAILHSIRVIINGFPKIWKNERQKN